MTQSKRRWEIVTYSGWMSKKKKKKKSLLTSNLFLNAESYSLRKSGGLVVRHYYYYCQHQHIMQEMLNWHRLKLEAGLDI